MALFTKSQFAAVAQTRFGARNLKFAINEARLFSQSSAETSVFLSHAHAEKELIEQTVAFLQSFNAKVYVDWMDESMSSKPNGLTGQKIKSKIISNDKFIFIASNLAVVSKWCNWEVGIGDAYKLHSDKLCILPLADSKGYWEGNEYLQVYPRVEPVPGHDSIFSLIYPDGKRKWFDDWLKNK
jgi:hypothetical protein